MSRRRRISLIVVAVGILVVAGVVGVFVLRGSNEPAPVALPSPEPAAAAPPAGGELEAAEGSFVGYRVRETFASIGAATAVGRTGEVTGSAALARDRINAARFEADLRTLQSDEARRDAALQERGLESARFPTARFELSEPVTVARRFTARGRLTLHGVTRSVRVVLRSQRSGDGIDLAGSTRIRFRDFRMQPPSVAGVVSVRDEGLMEVRLLLR